MRKLYVVQNIMILLEECKVDMPFGDGNYFTINPYYTVKEDAQNKLQKEVQSIFSDLLHVSWDAVTSYEWDVVYISSYIPPEPLADVKKWKTKKVVLVEDGLYDYMDGDEKGIYCKKEVYLHIPELASTRARQGKVRKIPSDIFVTSLFLQAYRDDLMLLHKTESALPILFTTPLQEDFGCTDAEMKKIAEHLRDDFGYTKMVLKKHPRDYYDYKIDGLEFVECPKNIPGQFMDYLFTGEDLYLFPSTVSFMSDNATTIYVDALPENTKYQEAYYNTASFVANTNGTTVKLRSLTNKSLRQKHKVPTPKPQVRKKTGVTKKQGTDPNKSELYRYLWNETW